MAERDDRNERPAKRRPAEGVRVIRPEEAHAALDARTQGGVLFESGSGLQTPPWSGPPTGEIPRTGPDEGAGHRDEDLAAWQALGSRGPRWSEAGMVWDEADVAALRSDEPRLGALESSRAEHSEVFSFDAQIDGLDAERAGSRQPDGSEPLPDPLITNAASTAPPPPGRGRKARVRRGGPPGQASGGGRDMKSAVFVGVALILVLGAAYRAGSAAMVVLATAVVLASALELYNIIRRSGFRPATLLGLCATLAVMLAAYWRGERALPLVLVLVFATSMLWYMFEVVDARPMINVAVTVMAFVWVGLLGSYASLLLKAAHGKGLLLGAVLVTVAADIFAFFAGSRFGSRPLARGVSPGKTWEGAVGGAIGALMVGALMGLKLHPWSVSSGLKLAAVVAVVAPIGDLCESMIKRDLRLKDSGALLPGHGGLLDRFDALLFVLPATYYLAQYLRLH